MSGFDVRRHAKKIRLQEDLEKLVTKYEADLVTENKGLKMEVQRLKQRRQEEKDGHLEEVEQLTKSHQDEIGHQKTEHAKKLHETMVSHQQQTDRQKTEHQEQMDQLKANVEKTKQRRQKDKNSHKTELAKLMQSHQKDKDCHKTELSKLMLSHQKENDQLKAELSKLKFREQETSNLLSELQLENQIQEYESDVLLTQVSELKETLVASGTNSTPEQIGYYNDFWIGGGLYSDMKGNTSMTEFSSSFYGLRVCRNEQAASASLFPLGLTSYQDTVYRIVRGCLFGEGMSSDDVFKQVRGRMNRSDMDKALELLSNEGHIYSTTDDNHFRSTDP